MTDKPTGKRPARGYSWPPFEKGNRAHLVHGAESERVIAETMSQMLPGTIERAPWLGDPLYRDERERYLRNAAKEKLLGEYILRTAEEQGIEHVPARCLEQHTASSRLATQQAEGLGMTPKGYVEIHFRLASMRTGPSVSLQAILDGGRRSVEAREARLAQQQEPSAPVGPGDAQSVPAVESEPDPADPEDAS